MRFQKEFAIQVSSSEIIDILTDIKRYAFFYPVMILAEKIKNPNNQNLRYLILERPCSFIPQNINYFAEVITGDNFIEYKISGVPFVNPKLRYCLDQLIEQPSMLTFDLEIKGIIIIKK